MQYMANDWLRSGNSIDILGTRKDISKGRVTGNDAKGRNKIQETSKDARGLNQTGVDNIRCYARHGGKVC